VAHMAVGFEGVCAAAVPVGGSRGRAPGTGRRTSYSATVKVTTLDFTSIPVNGM
jgi:hypothetical protein